MSDFPAWQEAHLSRSPKRNRYDKDPLPPKKLTKAEFLEMIARHKRLEEKDDCYVYAAFFKKGGALAGALDIAVLFRGVYQMANLGYWIDNRYWGNGFGKEVARAGLQIGFSQLKLNRLEAAINLDNPRSLKLAKSIGMRREGIKKRYIFEFGKWTDNVVFAANPGDMGRC